MLFNSLEFLLFFPAVTLAYWALRGRWHLQNILLLAASYFFYGWWDVRFLFLIAITTCVDYNAALLVEHGRTTMVARLKSIGFLVGAYLVFVAPEIGADGGAGDAAFAGLVATLVIAGLILAAPNLLAPMGEGARRKTVMTLSVVTNLSILGFFKYFNFFADSFSQLYVSVFGVEPSMITLSIVLPVGISFYTFQSMSYTIDVYRRQLKPTETFVEFAAYLSFFPQLVAGPIERGKNLLPQFQCARVRPRSVSRGALADRLGPVQEGGDRRQPGGAGQQHVLTLRLRVHRLVAGRWWADGADRNLRVRVSDLR